MPNERRPLDKIRNLFSLISELNDEPRPNPGIGEREIRAKFESLELQPSDDLIDLYSWHNGIGYLNAFTHFLSIDEATDVYKSLRELHEIVPDFEWRDCWFPVLSTNGDVHHCIDLDSGAIVDIDPECDVVRKIADHFNNYLDALTYAFEAGHVRYIADGGYVETDPAFWRDIEKKYQIKASHYFSGS